LICEVKEHHYTACGRNLYKLCDKNAKKSIVVKCMKIKNILTILLLWLCIVSVASSQKLDGSEFKAVGNGTSYMYGMIPFQVNETNNTMFVNNESREKSFNLSGYSGNAIHILEFSSNSVSMPNNTLVGSIVAFYKDGSKTSKNLISGVNIAEWAYDREEINASINHNKISAAYSWNSSRDSSAQYQGHLFYVKLDIDPNKSLDRLELRILPTAYQYPSANKRFGIGIKAITLEMIPLQKKSSKPPISKLSRL
jgi:hypothetical protein